MRITYKMSTSNYITNLNNLTSDVTDLNNQVASGRKYDRTSEDVSSAVRGYQIRRNLSKVEGYQDNISHAQDFLTNTETTLGQVEDSLSEASDKILQAMNGSQSKDERAIIAKELGSIQDQMLATLNTKVSDAYIFGGSNTENAPFTLDSSGKLLYNGKSLDTLSDFGANSMSGDKLYVDIGLGIGFDDTTKAINRNTVFEYSVTGISFVGHGVSYVQETAIDGTLQYNSDGMPKYKQAVDGSGNPVTKEVLDENGNPVLDAAGNKTYEPVYEEQQVSINGTNQSISNNVFNLLGQIKDALTQSDYSYDTVDTLFGKFKTAMQGSFQTTTEIGSKTNYLDFMTSRYETQDYNLQQRQTKVEGIDAAYTYIEYQTQMVAYKAALQMGQSVIQQSVFDYMS